MSVGKAVQATVSRALRETGVALKHASGEEVYAAHRSLMTLWGAKPHQANDAFVAPSASVIGNVDCWDQSSVWYGAVVRGDNDNVQIGFRSSIGDRSVVSTVSQLTNGFPAECKVGHYCSVGAGSVLTSCVVENHAVIGDGCVVGEGALVEEHAMVEPGSVVPPYTRIPAGEKWGGNPVQFIGKVTAEEKIHNEAVVGDLVVQAGEHIAEYLPYGYAYKQLEELEAAGKSATQG